MTKGRDIYMRSPEDTNFVSNTLETSDELEQLIGQIKVMLYTNRGEVLGAPDFGASLEEHLFTLGFNAQSLRSILMDQTQKFIPLAFKYKVGYAVKLVKGDTGNIILIDVLINGKPAFGVGLR